MSIVGWLILGLIAGLVGSKATTESGLGMMLDIVLGVSGAFIGGFLVSQGGADPVTDVYAMIAALIGAAVVLWVYHAIIGMRSVRWRQACNETRPREGQ